MAATAQTSTDRPAVHARNQRTCIGCGKQFGKSELVRIVRAKDGAVSVDASGRKPGRGAYVCSSSCFSKAAASQRLSRALRAQVGGGLLDDLARDIEAIEMQAK